MSEDVQKGEPSVLLGGKKIGAVTAENGVEILRKVEAEQR